MLTSNNIFISCYLFCIVKDSYIVKQIKNTIANNWQKERHYLKRKCSTVFSFGLFDESELIGVCIYGKPASPALCKGIAGKEESSRVIELTRLFIEDITPKNTESWFVSRTFKLLKQITDKDIIVSYADTSIGHKGTVYKALSFIYTGLSDKHKEWRLKDSLNHSRNIFRGKTLKELKEEYGSRLYQIERPRKHRFIRFNGSKTRKKLLFKKLKYKPIEYDTTQ